jgi:hypothetical protein
MAAIFHKMYLKARSVAIPSTILTTMLAAFAPLGPLSVTSEMVRDYAEKLKCGADVLLPFQ